jgi:TolB-like protein
MIDLEKPMKNLAHVAVLVLATGGLAFGQTAATAPPSAAALPSGPAPAPYDMPTQAAQNPSNSATPSNLPPLYPPYSQVAPPPPSQPETQVIGAPTQVLLLPFSPVGDDAVNHYAWVSQAIDESVKANLARNPAVQFQGGAPAPVDAKNSTASRDAALAEAHQKNAAVLAFGTYQVVGDQLRVSGEVVNVSNGTPVAGIDVTGAVRDLFKVEDAINGQIAQALPAPNNPGNYNTASEIYTAQPAPDYDSGQAPAASGAPNVTYYYPDYSPTVPYTYSDSDYGYSPSYYGYPYGLYGGGVFFYGGYGYGYHYHGNYWHGNYWHGGNGWHGGPGPVYHGPVRAFGGVGFHADTGFHGSFGGGFHGGGMGGGHR